MAELEHKPKFNGLQCHHNYYIKLLWILALDLIQKMATGPQESLVVGKKTKQKIGGHEATGIG